MQQLRRVMTDRDDRGVTLIEVIIAVALLAIIMVPLGNALIAFFRNTEATNDRLAASHDAQIAAEYFAQDARSIGVRDWAGPPYALKPSVERNPLPQEGTNRCGLPDVGDNARRAVIRLAWDDPTATTPGSVVVVSYVVKTVGNERQLHRWRCDSTGVQDIVVAHNLAQDPTVRCTNAGGSSQSCSGLPVPHSVAMTLRIRVKDSDTDILVVNLVGQRRQT